MNRNRISVSVALSLAILAAFVPALSQTAFAALVNIETVVVGSPGNPADTAPGTEGVGSVPYKYRIGKYEVTNDQYAAFLNNVDPNGTNEPALWHEAMNNDNDYHGGIDFDESAAAGQKYVVRSGMGNKPVIAVDFGSAARFANWLQNGQNGPGTTEYGTYTFDSVWSTNSDNLIRNEGAIWFIPSEDEWYKAAYYDPNKPGGPGYWEYPTKSNTVPYLSPPPGNDAPDPTNVAKYTTDWSDTDITEVGAYTQAVGPWGTYDQGGNVEEWNDTTFGNGAYRGLRGGSAQNLFEGLHSSFQGGNYPESRGYFDSYPYGFRVATIYTEEVPEPSTLALFAIGLVSLIALARRRNRKA